jgi:hypothetical protein
MSFGIPLFLLAGLAAAIPVLLHMIHRQRAKEIRFSTLRFLKVSVQRTRRRKYIDDAALMFLRIAVLLLIALGLARPAVTSLAGLLGRGPTTALALVVDNSASMALIDDGHPRFETARRAAGQVLDGLREGDTVALFLTGGPAEPQLGQLLRTHETVRQALAEAKPSYERADLAQTLQQATSVLEKSQTTNREIYLVTDNQALSWENLKPDAARDSRPESLPPVVLVNVNKAPMLNAAVRDVRIQAPAPVAGVPVIATAEVVNTSGVAQEKHVELLLDGVREAVSPTLTLQPGIPVKHDFRFTLSQPGVHQGQVQLVEEDGSALDNRRTFAITADQQVPVAIVKPRRLEVAYAEDSFYLERALSPGGEGGAVRVTSLTPDDLATAPLAGFAVVYCVNIPAPTGPAADRLVDYVRSGGHVVWTCGQNVDPDAYNKASAATKGELLPAPVGARKKPPPGGAGSWHVAALEKDYPAFTPLTEPASLYQTVLVYQYYPVDTGDGSAVRVLARLDDGQPLLVEKGVGAGSVLFFGTGVHVDWTNLPLKPIFLPLFARLTFHLAGMEAERLQIVAGAPIVVPLAAGRTRAVEVEVVRPSGETLRLKGDAPDARSFRYPDTHEAGVYQVRLLNTVPPKNLAYAVNMDPNESDPATLPRAEVERRFGRRRLIYSEAPDALAAAVIRLREGVSLRTTFLMAVLLGLVAETFLANRRGALPPTEGPAHGPRDAATQVRCPGTAAEPPPPGEDIAEILAKL